MGEADTEPTYSYVVEEILAENSILVLNLDNLKFYYIYILCYFKKSKTQLNPSPKINKNMNFFQERDYGLKIDNEGD